MDAYERSLKQQADRIRRELSQEGKKGAPAPKPEPKDEFVPSDVPSPIYGYARPKPKIILPTEHSPETRDDSAIRQAKRVAVPIEEVSEAVPPSVAPEPETEPVMDSVDETVLKSVDESMVESVDETVLESVEEPVMESVNESVPTEDEAPTSQPDHDVAAGEAPAAETLEEMVTEQTEAPVEASIISTETSEPIDENPTVSEAEPAEPDAKPILGEVSIVESGFASVFMGSTDLKSSKISVREEKQDVAEPSLPIETSVETVAPIVEDVAKTLQSDEPVVVPDEETLTPAMGVSYKAEGPPLNVMMTPQDRMAMYKSRRLAKKNNNL
ncbi:hypothetical protein [Exiguobacterium aurantiacum]|uniref:Uncharacterized protein n=1 Tax=Exiguobacterium aurantiacum TaxID=33987 RepID=A0ABY5FRH7_9BACL|nr:hypothetical protein [Exiguobacterium aurantiacum]UTT43980.1 hypothetical protein NMQ00_05630 [Exiguobacterium aurantiacum]